MRTLVQDGLVDYTIPERPTSRLQRYELTCTGRSMLDSTESQAERPKSTDRKKKQRTHMLEKTEDIE